MNIVFKKSAVFTILVLAACCLLLSGCFRKHITSAPPARRPAHKTVPAKKPKVVVDSAISPKPKEIQEIEESYVVDAPADDLADAPTIRENDLSAESTATSSTINSMDSSAATVITETVTATEEVVVVTPMAKMYYVQVGAFSEMENANKVLADLISQGYKGSKLVKAEDGLYRVQAGAFADKVAASEALSTLQGRFPKGFILKSKPTE